MRLSLISITSCLLITAGFLAGATAQIPKTPKNRLGVDVANLSNGKRLYGVLLGKTDRGEVKIAMEREWLKRTHRDLYDLYRAAEVTARQKSTEQLTQRIDRWAQQRAGDALLSTFLEDEKKRIESGNTQPGNEPQFIVAVIPQDQVRNVFVQPTERRKIVGLAWQNELANPTTTSTTLLRKRLEEKQVDIQNEQVNLARELPPTPQTDKEWSAKVALVEHVFRPPLEYQGTGTMLFRSGEQADARNLLGPLLGQQNPLTRQLTDQLGLGTPPVKDKPDWWKTAREGAEREGYNGVFVIRMTQDYTSPEVKVDGYFFAKHVDGSWFEVAHLQAASNVNQESEQALQRLRQEPQVKQIFDTLNQLGLPGGNAQIELALRHGAATQTSLAKLRDQFEKLLGNYTGQLDVPVVPVR
ncbi:MAG: hypothetical protein MK108_07560 [Mariniblastus sp.]|nr:hypothetical protein [Mariniblastus sp.]